MTDPITKISDKAQLATDCYINNCIIGDNTSYTWSQAMRDANYAETTINKNCADVWGYAGVQEQINAKKAEIAQKSIAGRAERQLFWTKVLEDPAVDMTARLRASELLGRSEADFTDNIANTVDDQSKVQTPEQQEAELRLKIKLLQDSKNAGTAVAS